MKKYPIHPDYVPTEYQDEPPHLKVTNWENFKLLILPFLTFIALAVFIWYMKTHPAIDLYYFENHSEIPSK